MTSPQHDLQAEITHAATQAYALYQAYIKVGFKPVQAMRLVELSLQSASSP